MPSVNQGRVFQFVSGSPALDLVNTLDWRFREEGTEELLSSYDDLLRFVSQAELMTPKQIRQVVRTVDQSSAADALVSCREMREAAADVLYAGLDERVPSPEALRVLERYFKDARGHQHLASSNDRLRWEWSPNEAAAELPLWILSLSVAHLMLSDDMHRLRACENLECRWLFLDTSKNHTRRWCDMKLCGNRMKARRFKAQHKR
jgi:predicted RNA-binding Zn ribbon-like protein